MTRKYTNRVCPNCSHTWVQHRSLAKKCICCVTTRMPIELKRARAAAAQKTRKTALAAKGLCRDCGKDCQVGKQTCDNCCRRIAAAKRRRTGSSIRYLGSKLSPERPQAIVRAVRSSEELLRENWSSVSGWIEEHFELWAPNWDQALYTATPLQGIDDGSDQRPSDDFILRHCYRDANWTALEDLVIAKIDAEKELKCQKVRTPEAR